MKVDISFFMTEILIVLQFMNPVADLFPSYVQILVFLVWAISLLGNKHLFNMCFSSSLVSGLIFITTALRCVFAGRFDISYFSPIQTAIARYQYFAYASMITYILQLRNDQKKKIFHLCIFCVTVTTIVSLYYMIFVDPQAVRNTQGVSYFGVGDFQLMYAISIFAGPYMIYIRKRMQSREKIITHLICFTLMCACVLFCNLVTAVVVLVMSLVLTYVLNTKNNIKKMFFLVFGVIVVALKKLWANILIKIANTNFFYWSTNNKLIAIANLLMGSKEGLDTLPARERLTQISLESFKQHPIFGINFKIHTQGVVGGHAQWADDLARFGIIGNIVIWINYLFMVKYSLKKCVCTETKTALLSAWIVFFILGFLNPTLSGAILMILFVVIPCFDYYYLTHDLENEGLNESYYSKSV